MSIALYEFYLNYKDQQPWLTVVTEICPAHFSYSASFSSNKTSEIFDHACRNDAIFWKLLDSFCQSGSFTENELLKEPALCLIQPISLIQIVKFSKQSLDLKVEELASTFNL